MTTRMYFSESHGIDLTPSEHWPQFTGEIEPALHEGPILIVAEYTVDPGHIDEFLKAVSALKTIRMRDGAFRWNLFKEAGDRHRFIESFLVETWAEYMRQQERFTVSDGGVVDVVRSCQVDGEPLIIRHFVAQPLRREK